MRKKTNPMWVVPKKELEKIVASSDSLTKILKHFNRSSASAEYRTLKRRLNEEEIDYSHIRLGAGSNFGRKFIGKKIPLKDVMVKNSTYSRGHLKKRLLKEGILKNECAKCGLKTKWEGEPLILILDHINGVGDDHRLENLRLLCPNCNSQTPTFAGRNRPKKKYYCKACQNETTRNRKYCNNCWEQINTLSRISRRVVKVRPKKEQLLKEIEETNYCAVGRKYGVTDNAIRKWIK